MYKALEKSLEMAKLGVGVAFAIVPAVAINLSIYALEARDRMSQFRENYLLKKEIRNRNLSLDSCL